MAALGPEFLNFIKKLEDSGDKLVITTPLEQPIEFEFNVRIYICFYQYTVDVWEIISNYNILIVEFNMLRV